MCDLLVRSRLRAADTEELNPAISGKKQRNECIHINCQCCTHLNTTGRVTSTQTKQTYRVPQGGCVCETKDYTF